MKTVHSQTASQGIYYASLCYCIWGMFPVYWYPLNHSAMQAEQILAQRIIHSAIFAVVILLWRGEWRQIHKAVQSKKVLLMFVASSFCIGLNWLVYLWAIVHNQVLDASLGYFINPLLSVLLGCLFFKEKLGLLQKMALTCTFIGIVWLIVLLGNVPYVALLLAFSFAFYGVLRKSAPMSALSGLVLETLLMLPFALGYLLYCGFNGNLVFSQLSVLQKTVLFGSGAITTIPLLLFALGAKRIPLSTLGMIQYLSPTIQLVLGLTLFGEKFNLPRFIGYGWVWLGVLLFILGIWRNNRLPSS